jgi:CRP-like cAMP-binding protein
MLFASPEEMRVPLQGSGWFMHQPPGLQDALLERGRVARLAKGQWLHGEGDSPGGLWAVLSGSMRLELAFGADRTILLMIVGPGNVLGQSAVFGAGPYLSTARAHEETILLLLSEATLKSVSAAHPVLWQAMNDLLYRQVGWLGQMLAEALCLPPRARIAARLLLLAEQRPPSNSLVNISQTDLAEMTGLTRKTANLHLLALEESGSIRLSYRGIQLLDHEHLRALVAEKSG